MALINAKWFNRQGQRESRFDKTPPLTSRHFQAFRGYYGSTNHSLTSGDSFSESRLSVCFDARRCYQ